MSQLKALATLQLGRQGWTYTNIAYVLKLKRRSVQELLDKAFPNKQDAKWKKIEMSLREIEDIAYISLQTEGLAKLSNKLHVLTQTVQNKIIQLRSY